MKQHLYILMPGALLLSYAVYTAFIPITIAHSLILFSLAGLFGYSLFIYSQQSPSIKQELLKSHEQLEQKLKLQKESFDERLKKCEDLVGGMALSNSRLNSPSQPARVNDKKIQF